MTDVYAALADEIKPKREGNSLGLRQGIVTAVAGDGTCSVRIGGVPTATPGIRAMVAVEVGQTVYMLENGSDFLIIGSQAVAVTPTGIMQAYAGATVPLGWLLCDGAAISRTTYARLFAAIGTTYGTGDGSATFNVPNAKGRVLVGLDAAQTEFNALAKTGGSKTSTAPHTHAWGATTDTRDTNHAHNVYARNADTGGPTANHSHQVINVQWCGLAGHSHSGWGGVLSERPGDIGWAWAANGSTDGFNHDHPSTNWQNESPWGAAGATHAHNVSGTSNDSNVSASSGNLPPYLVANYIIKT